MRELFVTELVKEVLGPRNGPREVLAESPLTEYLTGVLAPLAARPEPDVDAEAELPGDTSQEVEDEAPDSSVSAPPLTLPALDPKSRPASMGLSFFATTDHEPALDLCVTWARYVRVDAGSGRGAYQRVPRAYIGVTRLDRDEITLLDGNARPSSRPEDAELSVESRVRRLPSGVHHVTIFLVNRIPPPPEGERLTADYHLFQPQVRVRFQHGAVLQPRQEGAPEDREERALAFLYRDRPVFARGHICSAIWKEIDPEGPFEGTADFPDALRQAPFAWTDAAAVDPATASKFTRPDVRTEFVPIYSIQAPSLVWPEGAGRSPELRAEALSELWTRDQLRDALLPLAEGYGRWIEGLENEVRSLDRASQEAASLTLPACREVLRRIHRGIDLLVSDEDARLAFCFANKAIDVQARWARAQPLTWYPFQLAFVLLAVESVVNPASPDREVCDLLWVPTGAGKTEAYLALAVLASAHRRLRSARSEQGDRTGAGVSVLTRYTLRLLTIQQFRRALSAFTAAELLRVRGLGGGGPVGWRPAACGRRENYLWGTASFGVGLWVGGEVTPNRLGDLWLMDSQRRKKPVWGAISILGGQKAPGAGEPAQIGNCPACNCVLAVPERGLPAGCHPYHMVLSAADPGRLAALVTTLPRQVRGVELVSRRLTPLAGPGWLTLSLELRFPSRASRDEVELFWRDIGAQLTPAGPRWAALHTTRPGYFVRWYSGQGAGANQEYDFEIYCPNPDCPLRQPWSEATPGGHIHARGAFPNNPGQVFDGIPRLPPGVRFADIQEPFRRVSNFIGDRVRINAFTVDEQVYHRLPTMVVATVDKFARPAFDPKAAGLFGNVEFHHGIHGYYRRGHHAKADDSGHPTPTGARRTPLSVQVEPLHPPDLITQDELHLVEGPLGSLVGIYEAAVDFLCAEGATHRVKYVASTATTRRAEEQVQAVFARRLLTFPPPGLSQSSRFFAADRESHPLSDERAGRLYVGVAAPGRGPLTPVYRIWARMLQAAYENRTHPRIDPYWTLTGYFNAVRELGGARALYRQDIQERLPQIARGNPRPLADDRAQELSSRTNSTDLPVILDLLKAALPDAQDSLFTTSMFGTGVDVPRLGLMVVHGQPKTTSSYIQSTGRVGRSSGGLVVTFLRASRPRDLNHYEFFAGYHRQLHRFVEPITVYPFAPGAQERALGPVGVFIVRNMRGGSRAWSDDPCKVIARRRAPETLLLPETLEVRAQSQPLLRKPPPGETRRMMEARLDLWMAVARRVGALLAYVEYAIGRRPQHPVVLGDAQHRHAGLDRVFEDAPDSLRNVEETTGFQTYGGP